MISRLFPLVFAFVFVFGLGCGSAWTPQSGGDLGKADFAYLGFSGSANLDHAFLAGTDVNIRVRLHNDVRDTSITVRSADPTTFAVQSFGRGTVRGEWQAVVHGVKVGSAKLAVDLQDGKPFDTVSLSVGEPAKIIAPESVTMSVGEAKRIETRVEDKDGKTLYVTSSSLEWTLDADVATFYSKLAEQSGQTKDFGAIVDLRGNRPGPTLMHGRAGNAKVDLNVTVNK